ncbi:uncharacterized protein DS421_11g345270 [Arachis hypogaea]|nr:uncharacterized protein DS421_11g345270 [Arachis hypogaea]
MDRASLEEDSRKIILLVHSAANSKCDIANLGVEIRESHDLETHLKRIKEKTACYSSSLCSSLYLLSVVVYSNFGALECRIGNCSIYTLVVFKTDLNRLKPINRIE